MRMFAFYRLYSHSTGVHVVSIHSNTRMHVEKCVQPKWNSLEIKYIIWPYNILLLFFSSLLTKWTERKKHYIHFFSYPFECSFFSSFHERMPLSFSIPFWWKHISKGCSIDLPKVYLNIFLRNVIKSGKLTLLSAIKNANLTFQMMVSVFIETKTKIQTNSK